MVKRIIKYILIMLGIGVILFLVVINAPRFYDTSCRFLEILDLDNLENFIEIYNNKSTGVIDSSLNEIGDAVEDFVENVTTSINKPFEEIIFEILTKALDISFNFIIYFCNYGLNIILLSYILTHETLTGTNINIKTSPLATIYIKLSEVIDLSKKLVLNTLIYIKNLISKYRRQIALVVFALLFATGILYKIIVEIIIVFITYVISVFKLETYVFVLEIFKAIFAFIYPNLRYITLWVFIPTLIVLVFLRAIIKAEYKLRKNHERLKEFAKDKLTQTTFINGPPGTGKTLLNVSLSLASEENYIDELEKQLLEYELKYKNLNFALVRKYPNNYLEHKEYIDKYNLLTTRGTYLISNYAIYSPYFNEYSKIFNFDYMRVNKKTEYYPLDEYIVISLSEFDKEYNSHDNKKEVGEDGAATFFSTVSHDLKRHTKIFVDYQLKDQVPLRIRGNSEYFININKRKRKYPFLLYLYYLPIIGLNKIVKSLIKKYELIQKRVSKKSVRKTLARYKRNDITLLYIVLRHLAYKLDKISTFFNNYYYFKLDITLSEEDKTNEEKHKLYINIKDLSYKNMNLYDSTFLSYAYEQKKNKDFKDIDKFTSLRPTIDELSKCNSRFYNNINT